MPSSSKETKPTKVVNALRTIRYAYAGKVSQQAQIAMLAIKKLIKLHANIDSDARKVAGENYRELHEVSFEEFAPMAEQRQEDDGAVQGPGLIDMYEGMLEMHRWAAACAAQAGPPQLPSE